MKLTVHYTCSVRGSRTVDAPSPQAAALMVNRPEVPDLDLDNIRANSLVVYMVESEAGEARPLRQEEEEDAIEAILSLA